VSELPYADSYFDVVTAVETYYFWPNLGSDLGEVLRVLKPGGWLMIAGEAYRGSKYDERNARWLGVDGVSALSPDELADAVTMAGFVNAQVFLDYERGWICAVGAKPASVVGKLLV